MIAKLKSLRLVEDAAVEFHRLWVIRISIFFGVFEGVAAGLSAFYDFLNPWLFLGLNIAVYLVIIPGARLLKQADKVPLPGELPK